MKDENDAIIYVGKASNLHNRVRSYFQSSNKDVKTQHLSRHITHFEYFVTHNENEAFILENNLIKLHWPRFNIRLKDDKSYPYIKITKERLPRILYSNKRGKDKAKYYGPFVSKNRVRELLELIHRLWPIRRCNKLFPRDYDKGRPCLNHHIGQCKAPCNRLFDEEAYNKFLGEAERFIQGKTSHILERLTAEMTAAAEALEFERAAELRDTIDALKLLTEKQKVETGGEDRDVIAIARDGDEALLQIFFIRDGKLSGREHFLMTVGAQDEKAAPPLPEGSGSGIHSNCSNGNWGITPAEQACTSTGHPASKCSLREGSAPLDSEILTAFIKQFYSEAAFIPKELSLISAPSDTEAIAEWLSGLAGRQVSLNVPQKGEKRDMVKLAQTNAELTIQQFGAHIRKEAERNQTALAQLCEALKLDIPLYRIEAYDISNTQGYESVGSMIVFENGKAKNSDYRKFRLRAVIGPDDYAGMEEIITRRLTRYKEAKKAAVPLPEGSVSGIHSSWSGGAHPCEAGLLKAEAARPASEAYGRGLGAAPPLGDAFSKLPDIIFVDGGKGQISAAEKALRAVGLSVPICGMVKDDRHRTRGLLFNGSEAILPRHSEGFKLITRIQDEVHRFALEYHRKLRADSQVKSILDDIPGIGATRRKELLKHFKSIEAIRTATIDELANAPSMNKKAAQAVYEYLKQGEVSDDEQ